MGANDSIQTRSVRDSFVARFGEDTAVAIEEAAEEHVGVMDVLGSHSNDDKGSDPFKYAFLAAIGYECVGRYAGYHGITASEADLKDWALTDGALGSHDGDHPDYLGLAVGAYVEWVAS